MKKIKGVVAAVVAACSVVAAADQVWMPDRDGKVRNVPAVQSTGELLWTRIACDEGDRYCGWPTLCRLKSGELLIAFSGDRDDHICPWGKGRLIRSTDDGVTWSKSETIVNTVLDNRDCGLIELANGDLLLNTFSSCNFRLDPRYKLHYAKIDPVAAAADFGCFSLRSTDGGKTWKDRAPMKGFAPHGGIQLRDGRVMIVGWRAQMPRPAGVDNLPPGVVCQVSEDNGRSWKVISELSLPEGSSIKTTELSEPHLVELKSGRLLAHIRRDGGASHPLQSTSDDGGRTWTPMRETEIDMQGTLANPSHLTELADGRILCTYGRRGGNRGIFAVLSHDGGKTWDVANEIKLAEGWDWDFGYASTVRLADGTFLTAYYIRRKPGDKQGVVMLTHWKLKP